MKARIVVRPLPSPHSQDHNRTPKAFVTEGIDLIACRRKALDLYGDYSMVAHADPFTEEDYRMEALTREQAEQVVGRLSGKVAEASFLAFMAALAKRVENYAAYVVFFEALALHYGTDNGGHSAAAEKIEFSLMEIQLNRDEENLS